MKKEFIYYKSRNNLLGFTLMELLVVMAIVLTIGVIIAGVFTSLLRSGNKTNTISLLRQNGNYVISQVERTVRNAKIFDGVSQDGTNYTSDCVQPTVGASTPTPTPVLYTHIEVTDFADQTTDFACTNTDPKTIAANGVTLVSTGSAVLDTSVPCQFSCTQASIYNAPVIGIQFALKPRYQGNFSETNSSVTFRTTVVPRNSL